MECSTSASPCKTGCAGEEKSRYFTGMSGSVIFVASLSAAAFASVVAGGLFVAALQAFFFVVLPLASAAGGAFLIATPDVTPLGGEDPTVLLLVRVGGALALAYAGGAMLVGASGCAKTRSVHLGLMTAVLGTLTAAVAGAGDVEGLSSEMRETASAAFGRMALAAAAGSVMSAAAPSVTKKIRAGKPGSPMITCD